MTRNGFVVNGMLKTLSVDNCKISPVVSGFASL